MNTNDTLEPSARQLAGLMDDYYATGFTARHTQRTIDLSREFLLPFLKYLLTRTRKKPLPEDYRAYCRALRVICQEWIDYRSVVKGEAYWTVRLYHNQAARFFNWCVTNGYLLLNPMRGVRLPPSPTTKKPIFTHEEYLKLVKVLEGHPIETIFIVGYHTGFSPIDCILLKWSEVDLENMVITKHRHKMRNAGGPPVVVPIIPGSDLHTHLLELKAHPPEYCDEFTEQGFVRPELPRRNSPKNSMQDTFKTMSMRAGLYVEGRSFGSLRHTFLSRLTNSGCDIALGCKMSGHSNPRAFAKYVTPDVDSMRKALVDAMSYAKKQGVNKAVECVVLEPGASPPPESEVLAVSPAPVVEECVEPEADAPAPESEQALAPTEPGH